MPVYSTYVPRVQTCWIGQEYNERLMSSSWPLDKVLRILSMGALRLALQEKDNSGFNPYYEGFNQLILASQFYFPLQKKECPKMNLHKVCNVWVNKHRRIGNEDRERLLPVVFDDRLLKLAIGFFHMSREARSVFCRQWHHPTESIKRQTIMSEIGVAANYGKAVCNFVFRCFTCAIIRKRHPDGSRGSGIPLTLKGCPYHHVSSDTFDIGKMRMTRGTRNLLGKSIACGLLLVFRPLVA